MELIAKSGNTGQFVSNDGNEWAIQSRKIKFGIKAKLLLMNGFLLFLMVTAFAYLSWNLNKIEISITEQAQEFQQLSEMGTQTNLKIREQAQVQNKLKTVEATARTFGDIRYWYTDLAVSMLNESESNADAKFENYTSLLKQLQSTEPGLVATVREEANRYKEFMLQAVDAYIEDNRVLGNSLMAHGRTSSGKVSELLTNLAASEQEKARQGGEKLVEYSQKVTEMQRRAQAAGDVALATSAQAIIQLLFIAIVVVVAGSISAYFFSGRMTKPINETVKMIQELGQGRLTCRLNMTQKDEIGLMARAMDNFAENLSETVEKIRTSSQELFFSSTQLNEIANTLASGAEETSTQSSNVSAAAEEVSSNVSSVATAVEEMSATVKEIANTVSQAAAVTQKAVSMSKSAGGIIAQLGGSSREIGQVIDVITSIAAQTNILALNAISRPPGPENPARALPWWPAR